MKRQRKIENSTLPVFWRYKSLSRESPKTWKIVKASMNTGPCYGVKKCADIVFKKGKMIKGEALAVLEERMEALGPNESEIHKFIECVQAGVGKKEVMEREKKEERKRLDHLTGLNLNEQNLMKALNYWVIPVTEYVMNVCNLGKDGLNELDMILKDLIGRKGFDGR